MEAKGKGGKGCAHLDLLSVLVQLPLDNGLDTVGTDSLGSSGKSLCESQK